MTLYFPLVQGHVRAAISGTPGAPAFRSLLLSLMARPGRVLAGNGPARWLAYVLEMCHALGGDLEAAYVAASAVEFAVAGIDVIDDLIDDLIDDEWTGDATSRQRALNASLALGWLAQRCVSELSGRVGQGRYLLVADLLAQGSLGSCGGQDLDLVLETSAHVTEETAHEMTRAKSGSLVAMACQIGAALATDEATTLEAARCFGEHVGVVAQVLNDIAGAVPGGEGGGSDLRRRKKTLPVAYTLRCTQELELPTVPATYRDSGGSRGDEEQLATAIHDLGGIHYALVVADVQRREALAAVAALARKTGRPEVHRLRRLIPPVQFHRSRRAAS